MARKKKENKVVEIKGRKKRGRPKKVEETKEEVMPVEQEAQQEQDEQVEDDKDERVATVIVCAECGTPRADVRPGSGSVLGKCPNCGNKMRVTGAAVADVSVPLDNLRQAEQLMIFPEPKKPKGEGLKEVKDSGEWVTLSFKVTVAQREVIMKAMEGAKVMAGVEGKLWKGVALEWVCADFLAGLDDDIRQQIKADELDDRLNEIEQETNDRKRQLDFTRLGDMNLNDEDNSEEEEVVSAMEE